MIEFFKYIREYFLKKKLKKLLKERIIKMDNKISLKDNQFILNGMVKEDTEIVEEMTKWATDTFIFRNNDVLMPEVPRDLFGNFVMSKHKDLNISSFIEKYGNYSIKYLLYMIFINGYEAGLARAKNDSKEYIERVIDDAVEKSTPKESIMKETSEKVDETVQNAKAQQLKTEETENKTDFSKVEEKKEDNPQEELLSEEDNIDEELTKFAFDNENRLIVNSSRYANKTYEKYISKLIEDKLKFFGMDVEDIYSAGFPTFILGELLLLIENADAVNDNQKEIKKVFYDYFKDFHEKLTKTNTTV